MKPSEVLRQARELIADPARWTKKTWARDIDGRQVDPEDHDACALCALGALRKAVGIGDAFFNAVEFLKKALPARSAGVHIFNDTHTHAEVLDLFDRAIALAVEEEKEIA